MTKKPMTFRLSEAARVELARLSASAGLSATAVVEGLVLGTLVEVLEAREPGTVVRRVEPVKAPESAREFVGMVWDAKEPKPEQTVGGIKRRQVIPKAEWRK